MKKYRGKVANKIPWFTICLFPRIPKNHIEMDIQDLKDMTKVCTISTRGETRNETRDESDDENFRK